MIIDTGVKFLKTEELTPNEVITITGDAYMATSKFTYPQFKQDGVTPHPSAGQPKQELRVEITRGNGDKRIITLNVTRMNALVDKWGKDTDNWKDKSCRTAIIPASNGKKQVILFPLD